MSPLLGMLIISISTHAGSYLPAADPDHPLMMRRVFQTYYIQNQLSGESPDRIAWIGSLQFFLIFSAGLLAGPLFDRHGAKVWEI